MLIRNALAALASACLALTVAYAEVRAEQVDPFASEIAQFEAADAKQMPPRCATVFVGSSSIRLWPALDRDFFGMATIQRGFGGSQTEHANRHFDTLVARYQPARIVFYEGENDIDAGKSVEQVEADFLAFLRLKTRALGATPVYFVAVKPSPSRWGQYARQSALNAKVRALAETRDDLVFVDIVPDMLGPNGGSPDPSMFMDDRLHMTARGYAIWRKRLLEAFRNNAVSAAPSCSETPRAAE